MTQPVVMLEDGWGRIRNQGINALEDFLDTGSVRRPPEETGGKLRIFTVQDYATLYTTVYNMCTQRTPHNWSEHLYKRYGESIAKYVIEKVVPALREKDGVFLLGELLKRWTNHKIYVKWMEKFFTYLDRYYVKLQSVEPLHQKGVLLFHQLVFETLKKDIKKELLECINRERLSDKIDQDLVKGVIEMFIGLGNGTLDVYQREFEEYFLPSSTDFYVRQATGWLQEDSLPEYLRKAEDALRAEDDRVERYLHRTTQQKLKQVVIQAILAQPQKQLLEKETSVSFMLSNDKREDLARMYRLFQQVEEGLPPCAALFRHYVTEKGNTVVDERVRQLQAAQSKAELSDPTFIQTVLELHDNYKKIVAECFANDSLFQKALKEAFETFINRDIGKFSFAALLSTFCDRLLKKSGDKLSDDQIEQQLNKVVELFSFLQDKDLFADIYRTQLAKRMLYETSASDDAERSMIAKLKLKCGAQFTSKLEGMVNDLRNASEEQRTFARHCEDLPNSRQALAGIELSVQVLTTGFWPTYPALELNLAPEMQKALSVFTNFYMAKTQHRRLSWIHTLGNVVVGAQLSKRHDLITNTFQACILLLFNSTPQLKLETIQQALKIEESYAKKLLATLSLSKFKILKVANKAAGAAEAKDAAMDDKKGGDDEGAAEAKASAKISPDDLFEANVAFTCPNRKIKIPAPVAEETHNKERVEEDRQIAVEAAIVRIMKARKTLGHQQLITEVLQQLSFFKPNPRLIKQRIEYLIEREYLERDATQPNVFNYLA